MVCWLFIAPTQALHTCFCLPSYYLREESRYFTISAGSCSYFDAYSPLLVARTLSVARNLGEPTRKDENMREPPPRVVFHLAWSPFRKGLIFAAVFLGLRSYTKCAGLVAIVNSYPKTYCF